MSSYREHLTEAERAELYELQRKVRLIRARGLQRSRSRRETLVRQARRAAERKAMGWVA